MADDREDEMSPAEEDEDLHTLRNSGVVEKYKMAGVICNNAVKAILEELRPGVTVLKLAQVGDGSMTEHLGRVFNKGKGEDKMEKGIAFPTCISVNSIVCHYSPMEDDQSPPIVPGDVVKIDLGCHIDGYSSVLAHTAVVSEEGPAAPIPAGDKARVVSAAATAIDAVTHCFRPGARNQDITDIINGIARDFDVTPVEGVLSHEMKRYIIDGSEVVAGRRLPEQHVLDTELTEFQAWTLDIAYSSAPFDSGEKGGKLRVSGEVRPLVYKRALDTSYQLKMKASREVFSELNKRFRAYPFSMRHLDPKKGRFCISECMKHDLVQQYPVLESKREEIVAHFKTTILITPNVIDKITGLPAQPCDCDKKIVNPEIVAACSRSLQLKKKKRKSKKKGGGGGGAAAEEDDE